MSDTFNKRRNQVEIGIVTNEERYIIKNIFSIKFICAILSKSQTMFLYRDLSF